ncbi:uncharacterized protein V6R79_015931 [Siganus canaliculatus]
MIRFNSDTLVDSFSQLEQKIIEVNGKNNMLEVMLEDANKTMKFYLTKEKRLTEERDSLLVNVDRFQHTLQEQCSLRVENERLKKDLVNLKLKNEKTAEDREAEVQQLVGEMRAEAEQHKRALETVREQCRREVEEAHRQALCQVEARDAAVKKMLEEKDVELEELNKKLKNQEKEKQSELLKLQMEFGVKLARVQSTAQQSLQQQQQQQQQHGSSLLPQSVYKRVSSPPRALSLLSGQQSH